MDKIEVGNIESHSCITDENQTLIHFHIIDVCAFTLYNYGKHQESLTHGFRIIAVPTKKQYDIVVSGVHIPINEETFKNLLKVIEKHNESDEVYLESDLDYQAPYINQYYDIYFPRPRAVTGYSYHFNGRYD